MCERRSHVGWKGEEGREEREVELDEEESASKKAQVKKVSAQRHPYLKETPDKRDVRASRLT